MSELSLYRTTITAIGAEAGELIDGGVLILFDASAPPELAEVSVVHDRASPPGRAPVPGDSLRIGDETLAITAVGDTAWRKVAELGHVVFSMNGASEAERPGEICVRPLPDGRLRAALREGAVLELLGTG